MSHFFAILQLDHQRVQPKQLKHVAATLIDASTAQYRPCIWRDVEHQDNIGLIQMQRTAAATNPPVIPTTRHGQQHIIVADVRLDNRTQLGNKLQRPATELEQLDDHALILTAYQRWGDACVKHLLGDFAFVIWDRRRQHLLCGRDPIGNRPLFWFRDQQRLIVSSTLAAFTRSDGLGRQLDPTALAEHLTFSADPARTSYRDLQRLPAAHTLSYDVGNIHCKRYWNPDLSPLRLADDTEYLQAFKDIYRDAVECRMQTSGEVGILLSGGLDSTSVAATAAPLLRQQNKRLTAYSSLPPANFSLPKGNPTPLQESALIEAIAKLYPNIHRRSIDDQHITPLQNIEHSFHFTQAPIVATGNRAWLETALSHASAHGISTMLTGTFGNHTISHRGHTRLMDLLRRRRFLTLGGELRALSRRSGLSVQRLSINYLLLPLLPDSAIGLLSRVGLSTRRTWQHCSPASPATVSRHGIHPSPSGPQWNHDNGSAQWRLDSFSNPMLADALDNINGWRHQYDIDINDPTGDQRIIEFCLRLPEDQFLRNGQDRSLIRRAMQGKLPTQVLDQTRKAEQAQDWFIKLAPLREEFRRELQRMRHSETAREVLDLDRLETLVEDWPDSNQPNWAAWAGGEIATNYKFVLQRGIAAGRFILWAEKTAS